MSDLPPLTVEGVARALEEIQKLQDSWPLFIQGDAPLILTVRFTKYEARRVKRRRNRTTLEERKNKADFDVWARTAKQGDGIGFLAGKDSLARNA